MELSIKELGQDDVFDPLTVSREALFAQAKFYGDWQNSLGRETKRFVVSREGETVAYFQTIKFQLIKGKNYLYVPYGPVLRFFSREILTFLGEKIQSIAEESGAVFARLDFIPPIKNKDEAEFLRQLFVKSPLYTYHSAYFQPRTEWYLDLRKTEEELQNEMHEKNRYSIRTAIKRGTAAEVISSDFNEYFPVFYELMCDTAKRNKFSLHEKEYYENIFKKLDPHNTFLVISKSGDKILVVDVFIQYGDVTNYIFSGSSSEDRNLMPAYLAQWTAILHAKNIGAKFYNFGGIASGNLYKGWEGLTRFKKRFGGFEVNHSDFFDIVVDPFWYHLYNIRRFLKKLV